MSKSKSQKKETKNQVQLSTSQSVVPAISILVVPVDNTSIMKNENFINNQLILSYLKELSLEQVVKVNQILTYTLCGKRNNLTIQQVNPSENDEWIITKQTIFEMGQYKDQKQVVQQQTPQKKLYGMEKAFQNLETIINNSIGKNHASIVKNNFDPVKGALLIGSSGVGKSEFMKKIQSIYGSKYRVFYLSLSTLDESSNQLMTLLAQAKQEGPCIILLDDLIITKNDSQMTKNLNNTFESITSQDQILVLASISSLKMIDETLRRSGRFEKEIQLEIPTHPERCEILMDIIKDLKYPAQLQADDIRDLCFQMSGFTINDLRTVLREALHLQDFGDVSKQTLQFVLKQINPSGLKDLLMDIPAVQWSEIGGYESVKSEVKKVIEWPLKHPLAFKKLGVQPSKGILLYGPPGCCKTLLARAICTQCNLAFMAVKGPELFSKYVGDSEKAVRDIFKKARMCAPSVIFFDEIDAIAPQRTNSTDVADRVLIQLLTEMDGFDSLKNVIIVGATNRPDSIDKALLRPGRFDHLIYVDIPDESNRKEIFEVNFNKMIVSEEVTNSIDLLVQISKGYTGAEICQICKEAGLNALTRNIDCESIEMQDFQLAISKIKPRVTALTVQYFKNFQENLKSI